MLITQMEPQDAISVIAETSRYMLALNCSGALYSEILPKGKNFVLRREYLNDDGRFVVSEQPIFRSTPLFLVRVE